jgi:HSP20 family molecular chaperone IbpA
MVEVKKDTQKKESKTPEGVEHTRAARVYTPDVDIYEKGDIIYLIADIPGVDEKSIDIGLEKNILTLRANVDPVGMDNYKLIYGEYGIGDYHRAFTLSNEIDQSKIEAVVTNGVLRLILPKSDIAKTRKIEVKAIE